MSRAKDALLISLTVSMGIGVGVVSMELVVRALRGAMFSLPAEPQTTLELHESSYPTSHDPLLGYVPTPRAKRKWHSGAMLTITASGIRSNGRRDPVHGSPILAVGDSFTFGDEVGDRDTWPAHLERILERPVLNGGVFGYGFDQIVLRAERLLERFPARVLIVSLIPDDVIRCEYPYRYAWKPYFEIVRGSLELRNVPVPDPESAPPPRSVLGRLSRFSHLADVLLRNLDPTAWRIGGVRKAHGRGPEVARLLVDRIAKLRTGRDLTILLMLQWQPGLVDRAVRPALSRADQLGIDVLIVEPYLRKAIANDDSALPRLYTAVLGRDEFAANHMNSAGNRLIAEIVAEKLRETGAAKILGRFEAD